MEMMKAVDTREARILGPAEPRSRRPALNRESHPPPKGIEQLVVGWMEDRADGLGHFSMTLEAWEEVKALGPMVIGRAEDHDLHTEPCAHPGRPGTE